MVEGIDKGQGMCYIVFRCSAQTTIAKAAIDSKKLFRKHEIRTWQSTLPHGKLCLSQALRSLHTWP